MMTTLVALALLQDAQSGARADARPARWGFKRRP